MNEDNWIPNIVLILLLQLVERFGEFDEDNDVVNGII